MNLDIHLGNTISDRVASCNVNLIEINGKIVINDIIIQLFIPKDKIKNEEYIEVYDYDLNKYTKTNFFTQTMASIEHEIIEALCFEADRKTLNKFNGISSIFRNKWYEQNE
jgi:hypothetical protein